MAAGGSPRAPADNPPLPPFETVSTLKPERVFIHRHLTSAQWAGAIFEPYAQSLRPGRRPALGVREIAGPKRLRRKCPYADTQTH